MSNFNYMDNVPVKIAEKYKPPPRIYQLPQSIVNKLHLPDRHFEESPQFSYDFQLERKVLTKIPEWRRVRQVERETRHARKQKYEDARLRRIESQQKELLGAVSYPNAAELSSMDSDDDETNNEKNINSAQSENSSSINDINEERKPLATRNWSFSNILQPTIINQHNDNTYKDDNKNNSLTTLLGLEKRNQQQQQIHQNSNSTWNSGNTNKLIPNTFNYKDFEEDTSSPFDNIELKTINDLDILAQVLHNTQLKATSYNCNEEENNVGNDLVVNTNTKEKSDEEKFTNKTDKLSPQLSSGETLEVVNDIAALENTKVALEKVNFGDINISYSHQNDSNIPLINNYHIKNMSINNTNNIATQSLLPANLNESQNDFVNIYHNHNYLHLPNSNGIPNTTSTETTMLMNYTPSLHSIVNNANNFLLPTNEEMKHSGSYHSPTSKQILQIQDVEEQKNKSKSVPDILHELREEVRNSEMRRSKHFSNNLDNDVEEQYNNEEKEKKVTKSKPECYNKLAAPIQTLAMNISSMGFPLERVSKIAQIYGENDKKIVEHLIPLTELLDLGFDETLISEALIKFDNNKEKALEHLIS